VVTAPSKVRTPEAIEPFLNQTIEQFAALPPYAEAKASQKALVMVFPGVKGSWS
jgi:hypothetical protein